jgi:hypothetical protein
MSDRNVGATVSDYIFVGHRDGGFLDWKAGAE